MKNAQNKSILISLLESFDSRELDDLMLFVSNSYFNKDKRIISLLKALKKDVIGKQIFDDSCKTKVYKQVFDGVDNIETLNEKQKKILRARMSDLTKCAKRYLMIEALESNQDCQIKLLHNKLIEKKQFSLIDRMTSSNKRKLELKAAKAEADYAACLQNEIGKMNFLYQRGVLLNKDNFFDLNTALDLHYLINKLKIHSTVCSIKNVTDKSYEFATLEPIRTLLNIPLYAKNPLISTYIILIQLIEKNEENYYNNLLEQLDKYDQWIPESDLIDFYKAAINFCVYQLRKGNIAYSKAMFEIYQLMDAKSLILEAGTMQIVNLKNIVASSCHVSEFEWATFIVNKYIPFVEKAFRKSVFHFNIGLINFYQKKYKKTIDHLIRVENTTLVYDLDCRILLLKSYYQLDVDYDERTMQIFRSTARYINSNHLMSMRIKRSYKNFIQFLMSLYRIRHRVGKKTLQNVTEKLSEIDFITDKRWLLEKIEEIRV